MADNFDMKQFLTENQIGPYAKNTVKENRTAEDLFQMFKDEDLVDDRREYDEEDLMSTYPGLSKEEAEKLFNMLQNINEAKYNSYADVVNAISKKYSYKVYQDEIEEFMQDKASLDTIMAGKDPIAAYEEFYNIQRESLSSVSKEDKIQVIKEWIWFTCDEGQAKDDINKYNKMIDIYFASKDDVTKEDFKNLWNKVSEVWGVGDVGADSEGFPETWRDVQRGKLVNPSMKYEGKVKEEEAFGGINENSYLMAKNPDVKAKVDKIIELLIDIDVDGETMEYILGAVGMDDQMANQLVHNKAGLNERLEPHVYERMYNLSNIKAQQAMIRAAEILMRDLTAEGFEIPEIREFFTQLIANDI